MKRSSERETDTDIEVETQFALFGILIVDDRIGQCKFQRDIELRYLHTDTVTRTRIEIVETEIIEETEISSEEISE